MKLKIPGLILVLLIIIITTLYISVKVKETRNDKRLNVQANVSRNFLDNCFHIYLDMGSNAGVQVMKLFQPERFPNAEVLPVFDKFFGSIEKRKRPNNVCVVGFEPNTVFEKHLKSM